MKTFTIFKVGYSSGVYGCSGEYFQLVYSNSNGLFGIPFVGMYGVEERIASAIKSKGYKDLYIRHATFGKIIGKDKNFFFSEAEAIDKIKKEVRK